eukprot:TRINITY_DN6742_c0_g1_i1.p1 TRINITY_DN6742_c0_g1~~TRINITY_DN6742_c0_g1_i1.p1  ORF type:complete len:337 (+),score=121.65 TRINITY_DN6742_c0_g1_i1:968-1978(+)
MQLELPLDEGLKKQYEGSQSDKGVRWLKVVIDSEKLVGAGSGKSSEKPEDDIKALTDTMSSADECFYGLVHATDDNEWVIVAYIPDTSKVKLRMQYASTLLHLRKELGSKCIGDVRVTLKEEITWECVQKTVDKKKGRVDNSDTMTSSEKENIELNAQAMKEAVESFKERAPMASGCHTVKFPLKDDAKEALAKVGKHEAKAVVIKNESETLVLEKLFDSGSLEDVVKTLKDESRFIVVTHEHEDKKVCIFIYYASDSCPFKKRMQYAASKSAMVEYAQEAGCDIAKTSEYTCQEDITDAALTESLAPVEADDSAAAERKSKPKAPGRGGMRMLIA